MTSKLVRVLGMFAMLIALGACGDDDETVTDAGPEPAKDAGLPNKAECLDMAEEMDSVVPGIDCLCEKCVREITDCNSDEGCREIQACAVKTGCRGTGCYFAEPECMGIIDEWGSTSLSTTLAQQLPRLHRSRVRRWQQGKLPGPGDRSAGHVHRSAGLLHAHGSLRLDGCLHHHELHRAFGLSVWHAARAAELRWHAGRGRRRCRRRRRRRHQLIAA